MERQHTKNVLKPNMKKNNILINIIMNFITFVVGSFIFYQISVHLNKLNDYHVNKDMKYFFVIWGVVSIILRYVYKEIKNNDPSVEDEIIEQMVRDAEHVHRRYEEIVKEEKKKRFDSFKFLSKNLYYIETNKINKTRSTGPR